MSKLTIRFHELGCPVRGIVEDQDQDVLSNIETFGVSKPQCGSLVQYQFINHKKNQKILWLSGS